MPYSRALGLIFVAIPKTGSTSLIAALDTLNAPYGEPLTLHHEIIDDAYRERFRLNEIADKRPKRAKHLSAIQMKYIVGEQEYDRCSTFTLVRNPWARMVSRCFYTYTELEPSEEEKQRLGIMRKFHSLEFDPWIRERYAKYKKQGSRHNQVDKLIDSNGDLLVDHVGRLEDVQTTMDWVTGAVGADRVEVPHVNATKKNPYTSYYTDETREMVAQMFRPDIERFSYSFE